MTTKKSYASADVRLRSQYIGVVCLLGKLKARLPKTDEAHYGIDKAMRDANNYLTVTESDILFEKSSSGGYAAFPRETVVQNRRARTAKARFTPPVKNATCFTSYKQWKAAVDNDKREFVLAQATGSVVAQTTTGVCHGAWFYESNQGWLTKEHQGWLTKEGN